MVDIALDETQAPPSEADRRRPAPKTMVDISLDLGAEPPQASDAPEGSHAPAQPRRRKTALAQPASEHVNEQTPEVSKGAKSPAEAGREPAITDEEIAEFLCREPENNPEEVTPVAPAPPEDSLRMAQSVGRLTLECPECGAEGSFEVTQLDKLLRCGKCSSFFHVNSVGDLVKIPPDKLPGIMVQVRTGIGGWKKKWVPVADMFPRGHKPAQTPAIGPADSVPAGSASRSTPAPTSMPAPDRLQPAPTVRPKPTRSRNGPPTPTPLQRVAKSLTSKQGRWACAGLGGLSLAVLLMFASVTYGSLPSRSKSVAQAWLVGDREAIRRFVEPSLASEVDSWFKRYPPPKFEPLEGEATPTLLIGVERLDYNTARVVIRFKAMDKDHKPTNFVFWHRWVEKDGQWYLVPS
jgi:hypothetical protein